MADLIKRCSKCGVVKALEEFHRHAPSKDGRRPDCAECSCARSRSWAKANQARVLANIATWRKANPERVREQRRRYAEQRPNQVRAKTRLYQARRRHPGADHVDPLVVLERDDGRCGICGQDVDPFRFHVDHIVPLARGGRHTYANSQVAHPSCNQGKGASVPEEIPA